MVTGNGEHAMTNTTFPFLRVLAIVLLSLTAAVTLLGGIGTTCVAFNAENFGPRMAPLIPVKPVFQALVVVSIAAGLFGVYSTVRLARGAARAYQQAIFFLLIGLVSSAVQFIYSLTLRGSTAPNNMRLYLTALTLVVVLLMRLPGIWRRTGFERGSAPGSTARPAGGLALFLTGSIVITTPLWAAPTHLIENTNTANVLLWPLLAVGSVCLLAGGARLLELGKSGKQKAIHSSHRAFENRM
jgi:hypothetical protein